MGDHTGNKKINMFGRDTQLVDYREAMGLGRGVGSGYNSHSIFDLPAVIKSEPHHTYSYCQ